MSVRHYPDIQQEWVTRGIERKEWQQRFEQAAADSYAYAQQLLAAEAAIAVKDEALNRALQQLNTSPFAYGVVKAATDITIDLSALDKYVAEKTRPLEDALQKALLPIAAWKLTDKSNPYKEIGPDLRQGFTDAHDAIMHVLSK